MNDADRRMGIHDESPIVSQTQCRPRGSRGRQELGEFAAAASHRIGGGKWQMQHTLAGETCRG